MNDSTRQLEEKIAYLERHVTEQDKVMLEFGDELARLRLEVRTLRERFAGGGSRDAGAVSGHDDSIPDERPPHY